MLCMDGAFIGHDVPSAIAALGGLQHFAMGLNGSPRHPGGFGVSVGGA